MSDSLLDRVCSPYNIASAWKRFASGYGIWRPGQALRFVAAAPVWPVLQLVEDLRSGRYRPSRPVQVPIAKGDGSFRTLSVFPVRDRVAQRAVLQVVQSVTESCFLPSSFGFRPGRGVGLAIEQARSWMARGFDWVVDADIQDCFGSVAHDLLLERVNAMLPDDSLLPLISTMVGDGGSGSAGIAQGSCLSPWLCNVYLHDIDAEMDARRVPLVRYADDFLAFCTNAHAAEQALEALRQCLQRLRLSLHPGKTRIASFSGGLRFLGVSLARPLALPCVSARRPSCSCR